MQRILAFAAVSALASLPVIAGLRPQAGAQAPFMPVPAARAAPRSFPEAPAAPASAESAAAKTVSAPPSPAKAAATQAAPLAAAAPAGAPPPNKPDARAPARLSIPSIALDSRVVPVGVDSLGDMDVPSGSTSDVGWYAGGTVPGDAGSAVMDAHVFAAFARLSEVKEGDSIYVRMADGTAKRFVVTRAQVYKTGELAPEELFSRAGGRFLHLITCAGEPTPDRASYTHRLVVYAALAG